MRLGSFRLPVAGVALVVALALLFGGRWLYESRTFVRPLDQALRAVPGVLDVRVSQQGGTVRIAVRAGGVDRLEEFVEELWRAADSVRGSAATRRAVGELAISDSRTPKLEGLYYRLHFFLEEAAATGRYSELPARVDEVAASGGLENARVFVAPGYIYVQMSEGGAVLYEIIPRTAGAVGRVDPPADQAARTVTVAPWGG